MSARPPDGVDGLSNLSRGHRWVGGVGALDAKVMLVGEAPGAQEAADGIPFVGASGQLLDDMLAEAGLLRDDCYITNVIKVRPPQNDITRFISIGKKPKDTSGATWLKHDKSWIHPDTEFFLKVLYEEIDRVEPTVIIALGATAMWALTQKTKITAWRGSVVQLDTLPVYNLKLIAADALVVPTYHPAAILRNWSWRYITVSDLRRAVRASHDPAAYINFTHSFHRIVEPDFPCAISTLDGILHDLQKGSVEITVDIETRAGLIACVGLTTWYPPVQGAWAICIPFMSEVNNIPELGPERGSYWLSVEDELSIVDRLRDILTHPNAKVIGQNLLYDCQYFAHWWGFIPNVYMDTMIAHHVCFSGLPKALEFLASMYLDKYFYWKEDGKEWNPKLHTQKQLWEYNCNDVIFTAMVAHEIGGSVILLNLEKVNEFQQSLFRPVLKMMLRGVKLDRHLQAQFAISLEDEIVKRRTYIDTAVGRPLNPNSNKQLKEFFYDEMGVNPVYNKGPDGSSVTTDDEALKKISMRSPLCKPIADAVADVRTLRVYLSTFVHAQPGFDGRMRCSYNIAGTTTNRFSSSKDAFGSGLNLQNIPAEDEEAEEKSKLGHYILPNVRNLFVPDLGYVIVDVDLDRADLQVVVWDSGAEKLKALLRSGLDIHLANARTLFKLPFTEENLRDPEFVKMAKVKYFQKRHFSKIFVHGTDYGGSPRTMAGHCSISVSESEEMQNNWFGEHPEIKQWHYRVAQQLAMQKFVTNRFGYRRFFFDRVDGILPDALAWIPQSTVACSINRSLVNIDTYFPNIHILLQVHDSLTIQIPKAVFPDIIPRLQKFMEITVPYEDPLVIPLAFKASERSWGDCKPLSKVA